MSKVYLTNAIPCNMIAMISEDILDSKEIQFLEMFSFNISWTMFANLDNDLSINELSIKQNIGYQKIEHFLRHYCNNALWYEPKDLPTINSHFTVTENSLCVTPGVNLMYLANALFAKLNSICDECIVICKLQLQDLNTGIIYTVEDDEGGIPLVLPAQEEFMGELSIYDDPWWCRDDVSTYDSKAQDEEELAVIKENIEKSKEILEEEFKRIETEVRSYMTDQKSAEVIEVDFEQVKGKKNWKPKLID